MSLELWLFAVVMEVIVIGTVAGGTFMAYRASKRQSAAVTGPDHWRVAALPQQSGVSRRPTDRKDDTSVAA